MTKDQLLSKCSEMFDVKRHQIIGASHLKFIMPARFAMYKALRERGLSFPQIGDFMGGRHHTTIIDGVIVCERRMAADPDYAEKVNRLIELATTKDKPYIPLAA